MSTTTINLQVTQNGLLVDLASIPDLESADDVYGVKRTDSGDSVVASGTPFTHPSTGVYTYSFTDPTSPSTPEQYEYVIEYVVDGTTYNAVRLVNSASTASNILSLPVSDHYSSLSEVLRFLGDYAIEMTLEDWEQADASPVWEDIFEEVDETIDMYISQFYPRQSFLNPFLRRRATILAAHVLSQRRGNPGLYHHRMMRVYEELDMIRSGRMHVPNLTPSGDHGRPLVRNYTMQPFRLFPQRVEKFKSTGRSYPREMLAFQPYLLTY